ncbi:MAG: bifunctional riboflavin kinase/FAD synthetase [Flavobacteriales bacterium]
MKILSSLSALPTLRNPVVTLGTYDGVHIGHRSILTQLINKAKETGMDSMLITFDPHPRQALGLGEISLLTTLDEKIELLATTGLDYLLVLPFTKEFSNQGAEDFISKVLIDQLNISEIILGYDHKFGHNREGDVHLLAEVLTKTGRFVTEIPAQDVDEIIVSSTKIRNALLQGNIDSANRLLGYKYQVNGKVVNGKQLGRTIGYPTANIEPLNGSKLIPGNGVYAVTTCIDGITYQGMMNVGIRPTVSDTNERVIEVHLFDFNSDIYGNAVTISLCHRLRGEQTFTGIEALTAQLKKDEVDSRRYFASL